MLILPLFKKHLEIEDEETGTPDPARGQVYLFPRLQSPKLTYLWVSVADDGAACSTAVLSIVSRDFKAVSVTVLFVCGSKTTVSRAQ